jgi:hypothetical protein
MHIVERRGDAVEGGGNDSITVTNAHRGQDVHLHSSDHKQLRTRPCSLASVGTQRPLRAGTSAWY